MPTLTTYTALTRPPRFAYATTVVRATFVAVATLVAPNALALPVLSVDLDTSTAGIQNTRTIEVGETIDVDILIAGVESPGLNGFQFDAVYDGTNLANSSTALGDILPSPSFALSGAPTTTGVLIAGGSFSGSGAVGDGLLARITLQALANGTYGVDLGNVVLSAPFGVPIAYESLDGGRLTVAPASAVPEPGAALLFAAGLATAAATRQRMYRGRSQAVR